MHFTAVNPCIHLSFLLLNVDVAIVIMQQFLSMIVISKLLIIVLLAANMRQAININLCIVEY